MLGHSDGVDEDARPELPGRCGRSRRSGDGSGLEVGDLEFNATVKEGVATVMGGSSGSDPRLKLSGTVTLTDPIANSALDLDWEIRFADDAPNDFGNIAMLMGVSDVIRVNTTGTLTNPRVRPIRN